MEIDDVTGTIVDVAVQVHRRLGPGLLESLYVSILACELRRRGLSAERQVMISFSYDGSVVEDAFRADLLVERRVIVEVKSVERLAPVHAKQLLTYLRVTDLKVGLLLNFGADRMRNGIKRIVNDYTPPDSSLLRINQERRAHPSAPPRAASSAPPRENSGAHTAMGEQSETTRTSGGE